MRSEYKYKRSNRDWQRRKTLRRWSYQLTIWAALSSPSSISVKPLIAAVLLINRYYFTPIERSLLFMRIIIIQLGRKQFALYKLKAEAEAQCFSSFILILKIILKKITQNLYNKQTPTRVFVLCTKCKFNIRIATESFNFPSLSS